MKNVLIVYDSTYGNTEQLARQIASGIDGTGLAASKVVGIKEIEDQDISFYDGFLFGCPIHAFMATRGIKGAIKKVAKKGLDGRTLAAFETYLAEGHEGKALRQIENLFKKKAPNAKIVSPGLASLVEGMQGPLNEAELEKGQAFGQRFAQELE